MMSDISRQILAPMVLMFLKSLIMSVLGVESEIPPWKAIGLNLRENVAFSEELHFQGLKVEICFDLYKDSSIFACIR